MTVKQMTENMTASEFLEWLEYFRQQEKKDEIDLAAASPEQLGALFNGNG